MIFSTEQKPEVEKRKALYPEWRSRGIPLRQDCPTCPSTYMTAIFQPNNETEFQVVCERCGQKLET
jgi:hypothetical protein